MCQSCGQSNHTVYNCTVIHYGKSRQLIIERYLFSQPSVRKKRIRKNNKYKFKENIYKIKQEAKRCRIDLVIIQKNMKITKKLKKKKRL